MNGGGWGRSAVCVSPSRLGQSSSDQQDPQGRRLRGESESGKPPICDRRIRRSGCPIVVARIDEPGSALIVSRNSANAAPDRVDQAKCALYTPGHRTHLIQANLARDDDPAKYRHGTVVSVQNDGWITLDVDGEALRFWNHDPAWVRRCFEESDGQVGLPGWNLLHAPSASGGRYCICLADYGPTRCAPPSTAGSSPAGLFEQVISHGGFMVSGAEVVRH